MKRNVLSIIAILALGMSANSALAQNAVTANNDTTTTLRDSAVVIYVLANDDDQTGIATLSISDTAVNGVAEVAGDSIIYTPTAGFIGLDSFKYELRATGPLPIPGSSDEATVFITVTEPIAGIRVIKLTASTVSPNPVSEFGIITFQNAKKESVTINITDITGKTIVSNTTNAATFRFEKGNLAAGTYVYTVATAKAIIAGGKIAIK